MKKKLTILLAALMVITAITAAFAIAAEDVPEPKPYYIPVTGTVTSVDEYVDQNEKPVDGWYFINLALENDAVAVLFVTDKTVYPFESEIKTGDVVTGYYRSDMPMVMIYPPRYSVDVVVAGMPNDKSVAVDRFTSREDGPEEFLISDDDNLAIRLGEDTAVLTPDGKPFDGELDGRSLAVVYSVSTRSIPAQTTPITVYVLPEPEMPEPSEPYEEETAIVDVSGMPIIVNGEEITAPDAFTADGIAMVPLRAIAEELGFTVTWDGATRTVTLDETITLTIGSANCSTGDMEILLAAAPVIVGDRTYVPLRFFKDAAGMNNAYVFEGQIVIDRDGEIME